MKMLAVLLSVFLISFQSLGQTGDMEHWRSFSSSPLAVSLETPEGWYGSDSAAIAIGYQLKPNGNFRQQIFRTTDSHSGGFGVKMLTLRQNWLHNTDFNIMAILSNATITIDTSFYPYHESFFELKGGTPVTTRITGATAWLHWGSIQGDKIRMMVRGVLAGQGAGGKDSIVGQGDTILYSASGNYVPITVPIYYVNTTVIPDRVAVAFYSSSIWTATAPADSNALYVDDVSLNAPSGISIPIMKEPAITCTLNPVSGEINLESPFYEPLTIRIFDYAGRLICCQSFSGKSRIGLLSGDPKTVCCYDITDSSGKTIQRGKVSLIR